MKRVWRFQLRFDWLKAGKGPEIKPREILQHISIFNMKLACGAFIKSRRMIMKRDGDTDGTDFTWDYWRRSYYLMNRSLHFSISNGSENIMYDKSLPFGRKSVSSTKCTFAKFAFK